ncbi:MULTISPECIES: L-histidine N(alpha)-methyltransferase [Exiguobacterium]|uniref:L-histidine N(Alpha)-methyltransferase n=1 Tax=Exiguobacterium antarcticum TaxID=132920 RepID=A0ABT6R3G7_9BACL|nr:MULTISPECIES: L-histidine N(alpha)-methyltransferase [Exiguobacterium]MCT4780229.1 L-histidine N(alpha)-methyltransferase [Exiguobacterium soli]MDI3235500.1 L-histidine N(alpha)-methyltransferase [Exiguobacterium antarcticum]
MSQQVESYDMYTKQHNMRKEVLDGLSQVHKILQAKYFYDQAGSELFEQITYQPEYYLTRTELDILYQHQTAIADCIGPVHTLIEYGSGSSRKIKSLLSSLHQLEAYMPIDISKEFLIQSAHQLSQDYPDLQIKAVCGDYSESLRLPIEDKLKKVIFFPGSTIGNFDPAEAADFFRRSSQLLEKGDGFLIGIDTKKEATVLHQAYNDEAGITARFNLNILNHINTSLGGTFDLALFDHVAFYNEEFGRIEMHLKSRIDQLVTVANQTFTFKQGETIHTENSYKYSIEEFQLLANQNGFTPVKYFTDAREHFSVHYLEKTR